MTKVRINQTVVDKVDSYLKGLKDLSFDQRARVLSKSIGKDHKLTKFLTQDFSKGNTIFVDRIARDKKLRAIEDGFGFTSIQEKQAIIIKMLTADIDQTVERKRKEVSQGLTLDEPQKKALTSKLVEYQKFVTDHMMVGLADLALTFGVVEVVKEKEQAPANGVEAEQ